MTFHEVMLRFEGSESSPGNTFILRTNLSIILVAFGTGKTSWLNVITTRPWFDIDLMFTSNFIVDLTFLLIFRVDNAFS